MDSDKLDLSSPDLVNENFEILVATATLRTTKSLRTIREYSVDCGNTQNLYTEMKVMKVWPYL
jgi:hypothetical protein